MKATLSAVHPVLMVRDVAAAVAFYEKLGFTLVFRDSDTEPMYAGVRRDNVELHLQWHDSAEWGYPNDRPTYRFVVVEVDELSMEFSSIQGLDRTPLSDTAWGTKEFHVRDPDGNGLQFYRDL
jgi:catechol 2,3-dioxygenase-like lactoylglutathione lyase family enzyme